MSSRTFRLVLLPAIIVAVAFSGNGLRSQDDAGSESGEDQAALMRRDASVFLRFASAKIEKQRVLLRRGNREEACAVEEKLLAEECRFLERMVWYCRQDASLKGVARGLEDQLDRHRKLAPEAGLKAREAARFGLPKAFTVTMSYLSGEALPPVPKEDPKQGAIVGSGPGRPRDVRYGRAGDGSSLKLNVVSATEAPGGPAAPPPPASGGADGGQGDGGAGSGAGSAGSRSDH